MLTNRREAGSHVEDPALPIYSQAPEIGELVAGIEFIQAGNAISV